ncbi:hypothetical protein SAMN02745163_03134 [Clostridium cavendishii DSM 21758]|uniref:Uncharacterized protein n=1 Tax=Clostridium cavendishii DSM 21758 TaxID=1121302 RepID=A0A1M6PEY9_9CLOT|nr:hypothetical protein [Clostridium cavendishii]SHK06525.1 hypothetical protein SAMN02745163_03134 [Clostridium cavendishii DSM 21758]
MKLRNFLDKLFLTKDDSDIIEEVKSSLDDKEYGKEVADLLLNINTNTFNF